MRFKEFYEKEPIIDLTEAIVASGLRLTPAGFIKDEEVRKSAELFKNPAIATAALLSALSSFEKKYRSIKKYTAQLYAKTPQDRDFYGKIVSDLTSTGKYKIEKNAFIKGGKLWVLRRKTGE